MGHMRLQGGLPNTVRWKRVVELLAENANVADIAKATAAAAQKGLELAESDSGFAHAVYMLSQLAAAARGPDFRLALAQAGIQTTNDPGLYELVGGFTDAIDRHFIGSGRRTDISEMAQQAAVESLTSLIRKKSASLFGITPHEIKSATHQLSTQKGFSALIHEFFSRFTRRFLTYHLGRELSSHVGGNGRFAGSQEHSQFVSQLDTFSREAAVVVKTFAGDWYSKANFEGGITPRKATGFASHALTKLRTALVAKEA